ncbi:hypothetical protein GCM10010384_28130 [Streptomyces djakartensis]|uniref:Uncharacterized protein n=1 Tax=Streptomyces djakartensis TaxID=68193 RepID=A0ABQ2ZMH0_9ACTN|nr:hypothetical protein GCM10010384_28130 [Streptomyces djakartensis]
MDASGECVAENHYAFRQAADNGMLDGPPGTGEFLRLVQSLVKRPRRGERWLPSLAIGGPGARAVQAALKSRLGEAARPVPHCVVPLPDADDRPDGSGDHREANDDHSDGGIARAGAPGHSRPDPAGDAREPGTGSGTALLPDGAARADHAVGHQDADALRDLLAQICHGLAPQRSGQPRLRFRHFSLVNWAMGERLANDGRHDRHRTELAGRLRDFLRGTRPAADHGGIGTGIGALHPLLQLLWSGLILLVPPALFRVVASGRVPGLGRGYWWFMRQPYLRPELSGDFLGLAERLTVGYRAEEPADHVAKLLVHAFLEDLRRAFRRGPCRWRGWRHTAYPVVVVQGTRATDAGRTLLRLVEQVREETGRPVPVLLVHVDHRHSGDREPSAPADALNMRDVPAIGHTQWAPVSYSSRLRRRRSVPPARVRAQRRFWVDDSTETERVPASVVVTAPVPPWFSRRVVILAACLALLVPTAAWSGYQLGLPGCPHRPLAGEVTVRDVGGQCIGISDARALTFNDEPGQERLHDIQQRIFAQNRDAEDLWERGGRRRPYATIVYLGTLTGRATRRGEEAYAAEREGLEGMAVAQHIGLRAPVNNFSVPLLRIVIANAGFQMKHADIAVDMIAELARQESDAPVVGVVGPVESRRASAAALRQLNQVGLPAIAPALSADHLDKNSALYLQIAPPNRDQARLVADYARRKGWKGLHVYATYGEGSSREDDLYVATLLEDLRSEFKGTHDLTFRDWHSGLPMARECGYQGMLFFAGRWSEYGDFLHGLAKDCRNQHWPRHLVADDSVNRFMANPTLREAAPDNLTMLYVSKSGLATCEALRRRSGSDAVASQFLAAVGRPGLLRSARCVHGPGAQEWLGEHVGLAYDATMLLAQAVEQLAGRVRVWPQRWEGRMLDPAAVHTEILRQNQAGGWPGVTGHLVYPPDSGEPVGKPLSLLRVDRIPSVKEMPTEVFSCGPYGRHGQHTCREPRA